VSAFFRYTVSYTSVVAADTIERATDLAIADLLAYLSDGFDDIEPVDFDDACRITDGEINYCCPNHPTYPDYCPGETSGQDEKAGLPAG
jgi:hypothetical protein